MTLQKAPICITHARADARVTAGFAAKDTDDLSEGTTNLYYTNARVDAEYANLIVHDTGANLDLSQKDTDDLSEGSTNLYYTDARADARVVAGITGKLDASAVSTFGGTLIDDADAAAARTTLGLGTAATTASTAYATAAQGTLADSALQSETLSLADLKAVVAASSSFSDFQTRVAAL